MNFAPGFFKMLWIYICSVVEMHDMAAAAGFK